MNQRDFSGKFPIVMALALVVSAHAQQGNAASPGSSTPAVRNNHGPEHDPNMPPVNFVTNAPLYWSYGSGTTPMVEFKNPASQAPYLGFNENGSLIRNSGNGKMYYWKLTDPKTIAGTLTEAAKNFFDIPVDTLVSLQNPGTATKDRLEMIDRAAHPPTVAPPPPPRDQSGGLFGNNPRNALESLTPAAGSPADITGKSASIQGGVLTFTLANGSKSKPYNVTRPAYMASAPQTTSTGGAWIAMENDGKAILFNVQGDNSVTGKEIPPQVVQMLMQGAPKPR
jgi:hypothetical protein